jgi:hypothetical protein
VLVRQDSPLQQGDVGEHAWPPAEQVAPAWQMPDWPPVGTSQRRPVQQSEAEVQAVPCGWQSAGAWQVPLVQMPEQHWLPEAHVAVLGLHTVPASVPPVPPSVPGVPPSVGIGGIWHAWPSSPTGRHWVPAQQPEAVPGVHVVPTGLHEGFWHVYLPPAAGRQSAPPQHWSENWHVCSCAMQHGAWPV